MVLPRKPAYLAALLSAAFSVSACSGSGSSTPPMTPPAGTTGAQSQSQPQLQPQLQSQSIALVPTEMRVTSASTIASASPGEQARSSDAFVNSIGLNTHFNWGVYHDNYAPVKTALEALGVRHIREAYSLRPNSYVLDRFRELAAAGIHTMLSTTVTDNPADIVAYIDNYIPSIEAFQGPNEQNLSGSGWAPRLQAFTKGLYQAVKSNSATAIYKVVGPPLASNANGFHDFSILGNLSASMDEGDLHDYSGGSMPTDSGIAGELALEKTVSGSRPIMASEDAFCTANTSQGVSLQTQMTYTTRMFLKQFSNGFPLTMAHLLDENTNPGDFWAQCGLMTYNLQPKPSYTAIKNIIALLQEPGASTATSRLNYSFSNGTTSNIGHQLLEKSDGTFYLAAWLDVSDYDSNTRTVLHPPSQPITINFGSTPSAMTEYDFDSTGNLTPKSVALNAGAAQVALTDSVKIFKIVAGSGSGSPTPTPSMAPSSGPLSSAPVLSNTAAHWSFDENSGTSAADSISPAAATLYGSVGWRRGVYGSAVSLPANSYLSAAAGLLDTSTSYSVSAWLSPTDTSTERTAVAIEGSQRSAFHLGLIEGRGFGFEIYAQDNASQVQYVRASQTSPPSAGGWYHVVGVYNRTQCQISLYVNGSLVKSAPGCTSFRAGGVLEFGRALRGTGYHPNQWAGGIDEVNLYQRALTASEVSTLAHH